jgi:hypothetical protein
MYYNARFYDPYLNHFTQPDSIVPDPSNSQAWDRYAYAFNNPVKYNDPSGHCPEEDAVCRDRLKATLPKIGSGGGDSDNNKDDGKGLENIVKYGNEEDPSSRANCSLGWVSAYLTPDGSCGHVTVNPNAIVDPLAWEHIVASTLVGVVTIVFGAGVMIPIGAELCISVAGCMAGIPLVVAGGAAVVGGGVLVWSGVKFTEIYLDEIFVVTP